MAITTVSHHRNPVHLFSVWSQVVYRARQSNRRAFFFDFDGTLTPIRSQARLVKLSPQIKLLLRRLSRKEWIVGVLSGRELDDVRRRVGVPALWYAGSHGNRVLAPGARRRDLIAKIDVAHLLRARNELTFSIRGLSGIYLQEKFGSFAVHYRHASNATQKLVLDSIRNILRHHPQLICMHGKKVWELMPRRSATKWTALNFFVRKFGKSVSRCSIFYFGDDTTDESVFQHQKIISVFVGKPHKTSARFFLRSPAEVAEFLKRWNALSSQ